MSAITNTLDGRWLADSLTSDDLVDQAFLALSRCPHCGRVPNRPNRPNSAVCDACLTRCRHCTIYIFPSAIEAAAAAVPWAPNVNLAVGDLCIGCAVGDSIPPTLAPPHYVYNQLAAGQNTAVTMSTPVTRPDEGEQPTMAIQDATKNELYQAFEIGVKPPVVGKAKYAPLATRVLSVPIGKDGFSDWVRVTFADAPSAKRARSYLGTLRSQWRTEGHDAEFQTVPNGEACYLYIRRKVAVDTAATVAAAEPREGAA